MASSLFRRPRVGAMHAPAFLQPSEPGVFVIEAAPLDTVITYRFEVDGTVEKTTDSETGYTTENETNDTISTTPDGIVVVEGETGGTAENGDAYVVQGEILTFFQTNAQGGYRLFLDGADVTSDPRGVVNPIPPPEIPQPSTDSCEGHIAAAQEYASAVQAYPDLDCSVGSLELECPMPGSDGGTRTYLAQNGCEIEALRSYGWSEPAFRQCEINADCSGDLLCEDGSCVAPPDEPDPQCRSNADCLGDLICQDGKCAMPPDQGNGDGNGDGNGGIDREAVAGLGIVTVAGIAYVLS